MVVLALLLFPPQLQSGDFAVLQRLVPLLEELSRTYPEPLTQELATDLRIAICTHGACSPATVGAAAGSVLGKKPGMGAQTPAGVPGRALSLGGGHSGPLAPGKSSDKQNMSREPSTTSPAPAPCATSPAPGGLQELLVSAYDPQPPGRAAALRHLASLIMQRDPEAFRLQEKLLEVPGPTTVPSCTSAAAECLVGWTGDGLCYQSPQPRWHWSRAACVMPPGTGPGLMVFPSLQVFLENLQHEDAFVYLSAIQGERCPAGASAGASQERVLCRGGLGSEDREQQSCGRAGGGCPVWWLCQQVTRCCSHDPKQCWRCRDPQLAHWVSNRQREKELINVLPSACTVLSGTGLSLPHR